MHSDEISDDAEMLADSELNGRNVAIETEMGAQGWL